MDFINNERDIGKKKVKIPQDILNSISENTEHNKYMYDFLDLIKGPKIMIYTGAKNGRN